MQDIDETFVFLITPDRVDGKADDLVIEFLGDVVEQVEIGPESFGFIDGHKTETCIGFPLFLVTDDRQPGDTEEGDGCIGLSGATFVRLAFVVVHD